jgi:hypothetical protein
MNEKAMEAAESREPQGLMEASASRSGSGALTSVISWLHSEGFFAAERSLLREIESKYPADHSTRSGSTPSASASSPRTGGLGLPTIDLRPCAPEIATCDSAEKYACPLPSPADR